MRADQAKRAVNIFTTLVALSVIVALGIFIWRLVGALSPPPAENAAAPVTQNVDVGPALALAPFGKPDASFAPQTSLPLQLRGLLLAQPRARSTALIANADGIPVPYMIGQAVPGGATLEDIGIDHVLLRVGGRIERLDLPRVSTATAAPAPSGGGQIAMPTQPSPAAPINSPPSSIISIFETVPATPTATGFRVGDPLSPAARQAGLQTGDIIEKVNGAAAPSLVADRRQLAAFMAAGYAQLVVLRGDRRLSLSFPLR